MLTGFTLSRLFAVAAPEFFSGWLSFPLPYKYGALNPSRGSRERCKLPKLGLGIAAEKIDFGALLVCKKYRPTSKNCGGGALEPLNPPYRLASVATGRLYAIRSVVHAESSLFAKVM